MTERSTGAWPSQQAGRAAGRADARRNRRLLLDAIGELLAHGGPITLAGAAGLAGVSTATAYRHFRSADDLVDAFVAGFWDDVEDRASRLDAGEGQLAGLSRLWVGAVLDWGHALVYVRSRRGFLEQRSQRDPRAQRLVEVAEPRLRAECLALTGESPSANELSYVLAVWNVLADPREILDQRRSLGWPPARIAENLHRSLRAVVLR
jgi:AcrR family transcriptional regulator